MNTKAIYNIIDAKQMSNKYVHTANKHKIKNRKPWKLTKEKITCKNISCLHGNNHL